MLNAGVLFCYGILTPVYYFLKAMLITYQFCLDGLTLLKCRGMKEYHKT